MKILLMSIGTRGDVEPFLAIGEILCKRGHELSYAIPEQYACLIPDKDNHHSFTPEFLELLEGEDGRAVMSGSVGFRKKIKSILRLYKKGMAVNKVMVKQQYDIVKNEDPDLILYNGKCNYPLLWHLATGKKTVLISPVPYFIHYIEGNAHTGFNGNYGSFINRLTYKIANFGLVKTIHDAQKILDIKEYTISKKQIKEKLLSEKLIYSISPCLLIRPKNWSSNVQVLGYHERDKKTDWQPDDALIEFIGKHKKIVFLTFGSMINPDPEKATRKLLSALSELKIPTIINTAAGGLIRLKDFEDYDLFYFSEQIPYDWVLEKCYGIIHHGGSGTTHSGLKNGCVTMIIPHIFDQYGWNNLIFESGLGPKGLSINKISEKKLKPLLIDLYENATYKINTVEISKKIKEENLENELYGTIMN